MQTKAEIDFDLDLELFSFQGRTPEEVDAISKAMDEDFAAKNADLLANGVFVPDFASGDDGNVVFFEPTTIEQSKLNEWQALPLDIRVQRLAAFYNAENMANEKSYSDMFE